MKSRSSHQTGASLLLLGAGPEHLARHGRPRVLPPQGLIRPCGLRGRAGGVGLVQAASSLLGPRPRPGHWDRWWPGPVYAEMRPFPPAGAAPHAPGTGGPSVAPGNPRACLPEPAQDLGSERISCAHTLPAPDPAGHSPALSAPSGTCCPADAPSSQSPPAGHPLPGLLPTHDHWEASPLLFLVSSQGSQHRGLSVGLGGT